MSYEDAGMRTPSLALSILLPALVAGCLAGPVAPHSLTVEVFNQSSTTGKLSWQGTDGAGWSPIQPCHESDTAEGFGPGTQQITITHGATSLSESLVGPSEPGLLIEAFAIRADGQIEHLYRIINPASYPPRPTGC
jgi:hypothetical protein